MFPSTRALLSNVVRPSARMTSSTTSGWGVLLPNANNSRVVHGTGANIRSAFPPELNIPGTLHMFSPGQAGDPTGNTPVFKGAQGYFPFDRSMRMPRHVHMAVEKDEAGKEVRRFVVEKVFTLTGLGMVELAGEVYVVPPLTMIMIAPGVPHTWTPAPPGLDLLGLGVADEALVADGKFTAMFEYEDATSFYPTAQTEALKGVEEYREHAMDDLEVIRFPNMEVEDVKEKAWFIWGINVRRLGGTNVLA